MGLRSILKFTRDDKHISSATNTLLSILTNKISLGVLVMFLIGCGNNTLRKRTDLKDHKGLQSGKMFTKLTGAYTGITFNNKNKEDYTSNYNVIKYPYYYHGGGVAIGDINGDGLQDVFFTGNLVSNRMYLNLGDFQFKDITEEAGLLSEGWSTGANFVDINGDGLLDLYVCRSGPSKKDNVRGNLFYINKGDMTFEERATEMGLDNVNRSTQSVFLDYDKDGDLDVYVGDLSMYAQVDINDRFKDLKKPGKLEQASGKFYRNDGNLKFTEITSQVGMLKYGFALGIVTSDLNKDGWPDIYVTNDFTVPDFFYLNNKRGGFIEVQNPSTRQITMNGMGCDVQDINNDGLLDIAVVDMNDTDHERSKTNMATMNAPAFWSYINKLNYQYQYMFNSLQLNNGNGSYSNIANAAGIGSSDWSWSILLADFDNDGYKDNFIANGFRRYENDKDFREHWKTVVSQYGEEIPPAVLKELQSMMPEGKLQNYIYQNKGNTTFEDKTDEWGIAELSFSNGAAYADLDNDGDLDLLVNNIDAEAFVYRNDVDKRKDHHYLRVKCNATSPSGALHTKVTVHYGENMQYQELVTSRGYLSAVEDVLHFGLGEQTKVDSIRVDWLNGKTQLLTNIEVDQVLELDEAKATLNTKKKKRPKSLFTGLRPEEYGLDFKHQENDYDDFEIEVLLPQKQSALGPFISVGDVNGDQIDDAFIGGANGQSAVLYLQNNQGSFARKDGPWEADKNYEDLASLFFDADNDGDLDLYVVSGGSADVDRKYYQDRLYFNDGHGNFKKTKGRLPQITASGLRVRSLDIDNDGDLDLYIGGRVSPEKYPYPTQSYLLENTNGYFKDITAKTPALKTPGLINDILCTDFTGDGKVDIVLAGEWMPIRFFENNGDKSFNEVTDLYGDESVKGWWYSLTLGDLNGDGRDDIIAGNLGMNNKFHPSKEKPLNLYSNDFDKNGTCDVVLSKYYKGKEVPVRGKQCSSDQMPFISEKFQTFEAFAKASLEDMYGEKELKNALHVQATDFRSYMFLAKENGRFDMQVMPIETQYAPINAAQIRDFTGDGNVDILIGGNMHNTEVETPRYDAGVGVFMKGDGQGGFTKVSLRESGFFIRKDCKDFQLLRGVNSDKCIVVNNNDVVQLFDMGKIFQTKSIAAIVK